MSREIINAAVVSEKAANMKQTAETINTLFDEIKKQMSSLDEGKYVGTKSAEDFKRDFAEFSLRFPEAYRLVIDFANFITEHANSSQNL